MAAKKGWGGARKGAGRPPKHQSGAAAQVSAMIPEECRRWLEELAEREEKSLSEIVAGVLIRSWRRRSA